MGVAAPPARAGRRGRPPGTSRRELEVIALRLFTANGFEETTVDQIAAEAGVSRRAFFRYFDSKPDVLWGAFDTEVATIRALLDEVPADLPVMAAVRQAVLAANHYRAADVPELRARMSLIGSVPALMASAAVHYDAWERAISDFVARRTGQPADSLYPLAVGRATLAACRAGYDRWVVHADADLTVYLDAALRALAAGLPAERQLATTVMGLPVSLPVLISPTGVQAVHPDGEVAVARAAAAAGTVMGLSSFASKPVEEIGPVTDKLLFQCYWAGSRDDILARAERARAAGAKGLIVTLDWVFDHRRDWGSPWIPDQLDFKAMLRHVPQVAVRPVYLARWFRSGSLPDLGVPNSAARDA